MWPISILKKPAKEKKKLPSSRGNQLYQKLSNNNLLQRPTTSLTESKSPRASKVSNVKKAVASTKSVPVGTQKYAGSAVKVLVYRRESR